MWTSGFRLYFCNQFQCCQKDFVKQYGQWAVITGATDGIGQSMAKEFARCGNSILVIGRNETKLAATKAMLEAEPNVGAVETVKIDLSDSSLENFASIREQIDPDNRDIGILINNAGTFPGKFIRYNRNEMESLLEVANLNMIAPMHMTRMIMPGMVSRGKGLILNVSSIAGEATLPYMSVYAATKTFLNAFTRQLQAEYASHPLDIVLLTPGPVRTKLYKATTRTHKTFVNPAPDDYARSAINALAARPKEYSGTFVHELMVEGIKMGNCFGIIRFLFEASLSLHARHYELSPVPKRKNLGGDHSESPSTSDSGDI